MANKTLPFDEGIFVASPRPDMNPRFAHIDHWIFDLDNCLYPWESRLFDLIDQRMTTYIERLLDVDSSEAR